MRLKIVVLIIFLLKAPYLIPFTPDAGAPSMNLVSHTEKRHFQEQNRIRGRTKGSKRFILIQKAPSAQITKNEEGGGYVLTLPEIDQAVSFYKVVPNRSFGILTLKKFIWYSNVGKSMFAKDNIRGCLGVLSGQKGESFEQQVFELKKPCYDKKCGVLIYNICEMPEFKLSTGSWENVILTLDLTVN